MEFQAAEGNGVFVLHKGMSLYFDTSEFNRTKLTSLEDGFRDINGFIATQIPEIKDQLWETFEHMHGVLKTTSITEMLLKRLVPLVTKVYNLLDFERLKMWMVINNRVSYPEKIREQYDRDDPNKARTYLRHDYTDLVVLTAYLRPMVPVFGEFIAIVKPAVGSDYKEQTAILLLARSRVMQTSAVIRLVEFIDAWVEQAKGIHSVIIAGLGSMEIPDWLLGLVIVRRIAVGEIDANKIDPKTGKPQGNIISNIYSYVLGKLNQIEETFVRIKDKRPESQKDDATEESILEGYKLKQQITIGDRATFEYFTSTVNRVVMSIDPTVPPGLIAEVANEYPRIMAAGIHSHHLWMCMWVLSAALPPQAIECLSKAGLVRCMLAAKVLLLTWGYGELALLTTATEAPAHVTDTSIREPRGRMSQQVAEALEELYPYKTGGPNIDKRQNVSAIAIGRYVKAVSSKLWVGDVTSVLAAREELLRSPKGVLYLNAKMSEQLGGLFLHVAAINALQYERSI